MVTSDKECYSDYCVSRPMTLPEVCRYGSLRDVARFEQHHTSGYLDYFNHMLAWGALSLVTSMGVMLVNLLGGFLLLVGCAGVIAIVVTLVIMRKNILLDYRLRYEAGDIRSVMVTSTDMLTRYITDPSPAMLSIFNCRSIPQLPLKAINRSDGMGNIVVFIRFDDDHDRVMFRLAR